MLPRLARSSRLHVVTQAVAPTPPRYFKLRLGCVGLHWQCMQPAHSLRTKAAKEPGPPNAVWSQEFKVQLVQSAEKISFRYEKDCHKTASDAVLDHVEKAIGYRFQNRQLLRLALTHTSASEHCNLQLAWVGDAVLQLVVSEGLLSRYATASMGDLATLRSAMVGRASCYKYAKCFKLQRWLIVGNAIGSNYTKEEYPPSLLSELYEAVLGAIYVDAGLEQAHIWFAKHVGWPVSFKAAVRRFIVSAP